MNIVSTFLIGKWNNICIEFKDHLMKSNMKAEVIGCVKYYCGFS
ncbi:hypothetical protein SAMN05661086_01757 [Anaeromicropila populeti]|uniref:Uncharacterized protein n=1 Tax=Anaeromicropila populeti TaxID=37658 RepID=A0A1I6JM85_9FIRM|nr:hypothetical protein SAMN05661086_01757 [Anaeromicropila populeti]